MDALISFGDWFVSCFAELYQAWGTWGVIGASLIIIPVFTRLIRLIGRVIKIF